jgi:SAM-dependent methyltransferase
MMPEVLSPDSAEFARLLDAQYASYVEDIPLWLNLARRQRGPVLELGCGTGRVMAALAREGLEIVGLDWDSSMLERARRRLLSEDPALFSLVQGDLRSFAIDRSFALAMIPCNTFSNLTDLEAAQCLACVRRHLLPSGLFAIDLPNPGTAFSAPELDDEPLVEFLEPESGHPIQVFAAQRPFPDEGRVQVLWSYHELLPDGTRRLLEILAEHYLRSKGRMAALLAQSGYSSVDFYGDYEFGPLTSTSDGMVVIGAKR